MFWAQRFPNGACFLIPPCLCLGCSLRLRCPSPYLHLDSYPRLRTQLGCFSSQKASSTHSPPIRPTSPGPRPQSVCACPPSLSGRSEQVIMPLFSSLCPPASLATDLSGKSIAFVFDSMGSASCQAHSRCPVSVCWMIEAARGSNTSGLPSAQCLTLDELLHFPLGLGSSTCKSVSTRLWREISDYGN